jgi:hypothetical protein
MLVIPEDFTTAPAAFGAYENFYQNDPYYDYPYREYYDPENSFQSEYGDHVNPAMVESGMSFGYSGESSQTVMDESRQTKPRQQGQPTNIVPTAKMDRKTLKRLRNRVSASRCRVKKKEWISEMEEDSMHLHEENNFLLKKIAQLEDAVRRAKQMLEYYPPHS